MESKFCKYLDLNLDITEWYSEPFYVNYTSLIDKKIHKYYPDFVFCTEKVRVIVEVKPYRQLQKPTKPKNKNRKAIKNYNASLKIYLVNLSKGNAVKQFAKENGFKFIYVTEKDINKF